jgi:hypothetical protein
VGRMHGVTAAPALPNVMDRPMRSRRIAQAERNGIGQTDRGWIGQADRGLLDGWVLAPEKRRALLRLGPNTERRYRDALAASSTSLRREVSCDPSRISSYVTSHKIHYVNFLFGPSGPNGAGRAAGAPAAGP